MLQDKTPIDVSARLLHLERRPTVELTVTPGTSIRDLVARPDALADLIAKLGPRGCEMCMSGQDLVIRERFDDVINVQLPGRG